MRAKLAVLVVIAVGCVQPQARQRRPFAEYGRDVDTYPVPDDYVPPAPLTCAQTCGVTYDKCMDVAGAAAQRKEGWAMIQSAGRHFGAGFSGADASHEEREQHAQDRSEIDSEQRIAIHKCDRKADLCLFDCR